MENIKFELPNGKNIRIPADTIMRSMEMLNLSQDEAIQMYLEDEGYMDNEEQNALTQKAKDNRITATIHKAKAEYKPKTQRERVVKADPIKEGIISAIAEMLPTLNANDIKIQNVGKLITFTIGEDNYKLDLIRQRPPKSKG